MHAELHPSALRFTLGGLLGFGAINAFAGGYYGLSGARGIPTEWLEGSPFTDYFIPSLILFFIVGGSLLLAGIAVLGRHRQARIAAFGAATVLLVWITIQLLIIGYVSWMQPATLLGGLLILVLAMQGSKMPNAQQ